MVKEEDYLLSNQEILGGLKMAIDKGENLRDAMMTFYQAGYDKAEIEEAARVLLSQTKAAPENLQIGKRNEPIGEEDKKKEIPKPIGQVPAPVQMQKPAEIKPLSQAPAFMQNNKTPQKVSAYGEQIKPPKSNALTIALIMVLLFLVGILAAVFLFKDELVGFFNNLFG